jgi:hypothetical protein
VDLRGNKNEREMLHGCGAILEVVKKGGYEEN